MVKQVKSCCGIGSLKTGTVLIANISIIITFFGIIRSISSISPIVGEFGTRGMMSNLNAYDVKPSGGNNAALTGPICFIIAYAIHLTLSILMLFGAVNERARLICPWIIYSVVSLVVHAILQLVNVNIIFNFGMATAGAIALLLSSAAVSLSVYFILVVRGFYNSLITNNSTTKIQENTSQFNLLVNGQDRV